MLRIIIIYLLIIQIVYGYINIYPSFFYKELKKEGTCETFVLTNRSNQKIRYRIYLEKNLSQELDVEVYPKSVELNPYEKKEIKILMTPQKKLKKGLYNLTLVIKEVRNPKAKSKQIYSMLKLKLMSYYGDLKLELVGKVKKLQNQIEIDFENRGERLGVFSIYLRDEKKEWFFLDSFILKANEKLKEKYDCDTQYEEIKIEEQDGKIYFLQKM